MRRWRYASGRRAAPALGDMHIIIVATNWKSGGAERRIDAHDLTVPKKWSRTAWSVTGAKAWFGHAPHFTFGILRLARTCRRT